jgi:hypothetical protein
VRVGRVDHHVEELLEIGLQFYSFYSIFLFIFLYFIIFFEILNYNNIKIHLNVF